MQQAPAFETARPVDTLPPERYEPGKAAMEFDPGDFILVKPHSFRGRLIRLGQKMRIHGVDRKYVNWVHAALIVGHDGMLIEAVGGGVRKYPLENYDKRDYKLFRINASQEDRDQVVAFAQWALQNRASYGKLTIISIALSMLTGGKLTFFMDGQFVCSGLVASALERAGSIFTRNAAQITAADLAKYFDPEQRPHLAVSGSANGQVTPATMVLTS